MGPRISSPLIVRGELMERRARKTHAVPRVSIRLRANVAARAPGAARPGSRVRHRRLASGTPLCSHDALMSHETFMREAIKLAEDGMAARQGGPFGCVVVRAGKVVGRGNNRVTSTNDPTAHAEV